ncbi:MAG: tyrosine-type recombinase/integrase [Gemmataceae bacterium]
MASTSSFRVGQVQGYLRGRVWYLCYHEHGKRRRPRVGPDRQAARRLAAQVNGQLAADAPTTFSYEPIGIPDLRDQWLDHHEHVRRSSVRTVGRYRTATAHLVRFLDARPVRHAAQFTPAHAAEFARHLRAARVSPNGHPHTPVRPLLDKGVRFILECCRALFHFAARRRHLPPYAANPFTAIDVDRLAVDTRRPVVLLTAGQEAELLGACDRWQLPVFASLLLTGVRPGELCHLLLPGDLDLAAGVLRVRNKPAVGWQVKTRAERDVPLLPELAGLLAAHLGGRAAGPVFARRGWPAGGGWTARELEQDLARRVAAREAETGRPVDRAGRLRLAAAAWRAAGAVREERVRVELLRAARAAGLGASLSPKTLRHQFATALQEGRVDPLVRNLVMGHAAAGERTAGHGLGMTAVYTHTRPETVREQLVAALAGRPAVAAVRDRLTGFVGRTSTD